VAQTPEIAFTVSRPYERVGRRIRWTGEPLYSAVMPQAEFSGRLKMFGDLRPENLS
jgi:hypothetical protein